MKTTAAGPAVRECRFQSRSLVALVERYTAALLWPERAGSHFPFALQSLRIELLIRGQRVKSGYRLARQVHRLCFAMAGVIRAILGYCFLVLIVRIVGRRPGKQITPFEYVLIFFIGGVTLTSMVADDRSLTNALLQIASVAMTHVAINALKRRYPGFGRVVDGTPLVLLKKNEWQTEAMSRMRMQDDDVMASARDQGLKTLDEIEYAILERNGEIIVIPRPESESSE
jgi:hypothetical protein